MSLLDGDDRAPLTPYSPPEEPEEHVEFEYGVTGTEALLFVAKRLSAQLAARLEGRGVGTTRIELVLSLDRALTPEPRFTMAIPTPVPLVSEGEIFAILRARLESLVVPAPALAATLRAKGIVVRRGAVLDLFVPEARAERALPRLVAELVADIGEERVGVMRLVNHWLPHERARLVPFGNEDPPMLPRLASLTGRGDEPTRLLPNAKPLAHAPVPSGPVVRFEAVEWWRSGPVRRDFASAWIEHAQAMAWVETSRPVAVVHGWLD